MALIFADSFDHYSDSQKLRKWDSVTGGIPGAITSGAGRNSTAGWRSTAGSFQSWWRKALPPAATYFFGHSLYTSAIPGDTRSLCSFYDESTQQVNIVILADGRLRALRGNSTTLGTSTKAIASGQTNYIEYKITASDASGVVEVRVNGTNSGWLNLSSVDTNNGGSSLISNFYMGSDNSNSSWAWDIDDLYICDSTGGTNNTFLGDIRVQAIYPTGAGNYTQWTPSTGANYAAVDDNPANDETDYNSSSTASQIDSFVFGDVTPTSGTVYAVCVNLMARKDDAGTRTLRALARLSGTDATGSSVNIGTSYVVYQSILETKPGGGSWSISDVNNSEFGYELVA
jgi:hypothetical protein